MMSFLLKGDPFYIFEKPFRKRLGVATYFCLFFTRENKIRNKNLSVTPFLENMSLRETESKFGGHITYWEGMVVNRSTSLRP